MPHHCRASHRPDDCGGDTLAYYPLVGPVNFVPVCSLSSLPNIFSVRSVHTLLVAFRRRLAQCTRPEHTRLITEDAEQEQPRRRQPVPCARPWLLCDPLSGDILRTYIYLYDIVFTRGVWGPYIFSNVALTVWSLVSAASSRSRTGRGADLVVPCNYGNKTHECAGRRAPALHTGRY